MQDLDLETMDDFDDADATEFLEHELGYEPAMCGWCGFVCTTTRVCECCGEVVGE